jgi:hypothetical protein
LAERNGERQARKHEKQDDGRSPVPEGAQGRQVSQPRWPCFLRDGVGEHHCEGRDPTKRIEGRNTARIALGHGEYSALQSQLYERLRFSVSASSEAREEVIRKKNTLARCQYRNSRRSISTKALGISAALHINDCADASQPIWRYLK